jgi:UDP-N-acetylmuramyl pentapeptide phosphotransferase/UDP-N-acetylglucosamine-1-phosphate transferase
MNFVWPFQYFLIIGFVLFAFVQIYLRLAVKYNLFDTPNERSSHTKRTIRGGGVIFLIAIIGYLFISKGQYFTVLAGALALGVISFVDDVKNLPAKLRLALHFIVVIFLLYDLDLLHFTWLLPVLMVFILWLMNAYNFMDGINGITFSNTLSHLFALVYAAYLTGFIDLNLLYLLILTNLVFGYYNFRKQAICFLGDVGSIPLGFVLIALTLLLVIDNGSIDPLVFFSLYMIDSGWTIVQRILNRENILKPHRKHLYQLLANEYKIGHLEISTGFFMIQMVINTGYFILDDRIEGNGYFFLVIAISSSVYIPLKYFLVKRASET